MVPDWLHNTWFATELTVGIGFTVMSNEEGVPEHVVPPLVNAGVIVIVAVTGAVVELVTVNEGILPVPPAARPMEVFELTQLYRVPGTLPVKLTAEVFAEWHSTWLTWRLTVGIGFTVILKDEGAPVQVSPAFVNEGVTVMVALTGALVAFVAGKDEISPVPPAARPMAGFELTQL